MKERTDLKLNIQRTNELPVVWSERDVEQASSTPVGDRIKCADFLPLPMLAMLILVHLIHFQDLIDYLRGMRASKVSIIQQDRASYSLRSYPRCSD